MADLSEEDLAQVEGDSLADRLARNEPVFEPTVLNSLADADLPLRGPLRRRVVENARDSVVERRSIEGISNRLAANISAPISQIIEQSIRDRVRERIQESVTRVATNTGDT